MNTIQPRPNTRNRNNFFYQTLNNSNMLYSPITSTISRNNLFATRNLNKNIQTLVEENQASWKAQDKLKVKRPVTTTWKRKTYWDDIQNEKIVEKELLPG